MRRNKDAVIGRHARKAAQIMDERGWIRGTREARAGNVCLTGAFFRAVRPMGLVLSSYWTEEFSERFAHWMYDHHNAYVERGDYFRAENWNDHVFQSKEETLAWLNKFADDLDPQR